MAIGLSACYRNRQLHFHVSTSPWGVTANKQTATYRTHTQHAYIYIHIYICMYVVNADAGGEHRLAASEAEPQSAAQGWNSFGWAQLVGTCPADCSNDSEVRVPRGPTFVPALEPASAWLAPREPPPNDQPEQASAQTPSAAEATTLPAADALTTATQLAAPAPATPRVDGDDAPDGLSIGQSSLPLSHMP